MKIFSATQIDAKEAEELYHSISADIQTGSTSPARFGSGMFLVEYQELAEWGKEFVGSFNLKLSTPIGLVGCETMRSSDGTQFWRNPHAVGVFPYVYIDPSQRLIHEFKKATSQLPKKGPGLVHIGIPQKDGRKFLEMVDNSFMRLFHKLNRDTQRVNAIIVSSYAFGSTENDPFRRYHFVIPNLRPRSVLYSDFKVFGSTSEAAVEQTGSIVLRFRPGWWRAGTMGILYSMCSADGKQQVRLSKTPDDRIRLELFNPVYFWRHVESGPLKVRSGDPSQVTATWDEERIRIWFDATLLAEDVRPQ